MNTFNKQILKYFEGSSFSNNLLLTLDKPNNRLNSREFIIKNIVEGKKVIHLGCADHIELIDKKIQQNTWLHGNLESTTSEIVGIDINCDAINFLKNKYNKKNIYCFDVFKDGIPKEISSNKYDYLLLGEILEHTDNPVSFLKQLNTKFGRNVSNIIITVPNFLSFNNLKKAFSNSEQINSDHRYWFSPYTLSKVCMRADIFPLHYSFYTSNRYNIFYRQILKKFNLFQDGLVWIGRLNS